MEPKEKKPLRIPNRDKRGRFSENMANFPPDELAKAIAEFSANKPKEAK